MRWLDRELLYDTASAAVVIDVFVFYIGRKNCSQFPDNVLEFAWKNYWQPEKKKSEYLVPQQRNCLNTSLKCLVTGFWNSVCGN